MSAPLREPVFNAPWPSIVMVLLILGSYLWQSTLGGGLRAAELYGLSSTALEHGRWGSLLSMMFIHAGWTHAIMNAIAALAFGPPVARLLGPGARGAAAFFSFYLVCGVLAALGYVALHPASAEPVVGASGAVSGLMGAAARLYGAPGPGRLSPMLSRPVLSFGISYILVNAIMAVAGSPVMLGARIAWEAHIAGFLAGALLLGPWARLFGSPLRRDDLNGS